jgi:hypothetical protein
MSIHLPLPVRKSAPQKSSGVAVVLTILGASPVDPKLIRNAILVEDNGEWVGQRPSGIRYRLVNLRYADGSWRAFGV